MSDRERSTLTAGLAVLLTAAALLPLFEDAGWVGRAMVAVGAVALAGVVTRRIGVPPLLQPVAGAVVVAVAVAVAFGGSTLWLGLVPTAATVPELGRLLGEGLLDVELLTVPVPTTPGLVLLVVLGVAVVALLVDLVAVVLDRPALAGLPLLAAFVIPAAFQPGGSAAWYFALAATGWLALLLADGSARVARWGTALPAPTRRRLQRGSGAPALGRSGRRIGLAAVGVALVVPALVPNLDGTLLPGRGTGDGLGGPRTTTTYNPITTLGGQLRLPEPGRQLLTYRTDDPAPDYLRLTTLDLFSDQSGWSSSDLEGNARDDAVSRGIGPPAGLRSASAQPVQTVITVGPALDTPWLPVPVVPTAVEVDGPWIWDDGSGTVFSTRLTTLELDAPYQVEAQRPVPTAEQLRAASGAPREVRDRYATPPEVSPYVAELTAQAVAGAETDYDRVAAIQAFFRDGSQGFRYSESTDVPGIDAPNALERFLRGRAGFCEQYASAMAAMVRLEGLPARVAVGFIPGVPQPDGSRVVTTSDAHAWPEVWFDGAGWVRFEPTPRSNQRTVSTPDYSVPGAEDAAADDAAAPVEPEAPADPAAPEPAPGTDQDRGATADGGSDDALGGGSPLRSTPLLVAAGLLLLASVPAVATAARRRRRWARPGPLTAWEQVRDDAVDVGHRWRGSDSPRAAAARLARSRDLPEHAVLALDRIAAAAERARYAPPGSGAGTGDGLAAEVDAVRAGLRATTTRGGRWRARLLPTSTLHWAADGAVDGWGRLRDRGLAARGRLVDRLRRRARPA